MFKNDSDNFKCFGVKQPFCKIIRLKRTDSAGGNEMKIQTREICEMLRFNRRTSGASFNFFLSIIIIIIIKSSETV